LLHDAVNGGETEASAFPHLLGCEKRFEDARTRLRVHSMSRISNHDREVFSPCEECLWFSRAPGNRNILGFDAQAASLRHSVASVPSQVQDNLLQLSSIHLRPSKVRIEQQVEGDVLTEHAPQDVIHVFQNRVELQDRRLEELIPAIREKLIGKPCAALGCFPNLVDARSSNLGRLTALQQKFAMAQNDGQEITKIMGDAASELADRLHSADLPHRAVRSNRFFLPSGVAAPTRAPGIGSFLFSFCFARERRLPRIGDSADTTRLLDNIFKNGAPGREEDGFNQATNLTNEATRKI